MYVTETLSPGDAFRRAARRSSADAIVASPNLVTTSPAFRPAFSAGPPLTTSRMTAPWSTDSLYACAVSGSSVAGSMPMNAWRTWPVSISCWIVSVTVGAGMAKPIDTALADGGMYATLIPMTLPSTPTTAPPELPGEIGASVWMRSTSAGDVLADPGIVRPRPEMIPSVTLPSKPSGLPIAIAVSPTLGRVVRNDAAGMFVRVTFTTARSTRGSADWTVPSARVPSANATVTVLTPSMTWLLVITIPDGSHTTPLPCAPSARRIATTDGLTCAMRSGIETVPVPLVVDVPPAVAVPPLAVAVDAPGATLPATAPLWLLVAPVLDVAAGAEEAGCAEADEPACVAAALAAAPERFVVEPL